MELFYKIGIYGIIVLGVAHSLLTFKFYKKDKENAFWFLSAGIALILAGILNYMTLNTITEHLIPLVIANTILFAFALALAISQKKITMYLVVLFSFILLLMPLLINYGI